MAKRFNGPVHQETFPAGTYYIGDLCYCFPNQGPKEPLWGELCNILFNGVENPQGWKKFFDFHGHRVGTDSTEWGDGRYDGSDGKKYAVDSGSIGILPIELMRFAEPEYTDERLSELASIVTFDKPFRVKFDNGEFWFGDIYINTCDEEEEEEPWGYEKEEDEE